MAAKQMTPVVVDLSHHNEVDDWKKVYDFGIRGVIHKASQGTGMVDNMYASRRKAATAAGLLWGAYHFAESSDVKRQVEHFLDIAKPDDRTLLCLDWEELYLGGRRRKDREMSLTQVKEFLRLVYDKTGQHPLLYSGSLIKETLGKKADAELSKYRLWMPQYGPKAVLPPGFASYWLWQYAADGYGPLPREVPGITTPTEDMNVFGGKDLEAEWIDRGAPVVVAAASPAPEPVPQVPISPPVVAAPPVVTAPAVSTPAPPTRVPVSVPPPPGQATVKSLRPFSRKLLLLKWGKRVAAFFGFSLGSDITLQQAVNQSQGATNVIETLIANPMLVAVVSVSIAVVCVCAVLEIYHVDGYNGSGDDAQRAG